MVRQLQVVAKNVRMGAADVGGGPLGDDAGGFGTDAAISRGRYAVRPTGNGRLAAPPCVDGDAAALPYCGHIC